mmetsp:Transcript_93193/g.240826  ORF Transcript_93193/g.240826 Transcript_93193/m.240826 type:complete len:497 (+) Transcript_93193:128-1618(+)
MASAAVAVRQRTYQLVFPGVACATCFAMPDLASATASLEEEVPTPSTKPGADSRLRRLRMTPCSVCKVAMFCSDECARDAGSDHLQWCPELAKLPSPSLEIEEWHSRYLPKSKKYKLASRKHGPEGFKAKCVATADFIDKLPLHKGTMVNCGEIVCDAYMYGRHCIVCNRVAGVRLLPCRECLSDWSCEDHYENHQRRNKLLRHTRDKCQKFRDFAAVTLRDRRAGLNDADVASSTTRALGTIDIASWTNWDDFWSWRFGGGVDGGFRRADRIAATYDASPPLTLLLQLQRFDLLQRKSLVIHVLGAGLMDARSDGAMWRLILHHIRPLIRLRLVFIGPQARPLMQPTWPVSAVDEDQWSVRVENMLYQEFMAPGNNHCEPDLAMLFNAGLAPEIYKGSWDAAVQLLMDMRTPSVVTIRTEEFEEELGALRSLGAHIVEQVRVNPFRALLPELRPGRATQYEVNSHSYISFRGRRAAGVKSPSPSPPPAKRARRQA